MPLRDTDTATFAADVLEAGKPALVLFWAPWCGPARHVQPEIIAIEEEYGERVSLWRCDTDRNPDTAHRYGVRTLPSVLVFAAGEPIVYHAGFIERDDLAERLDSALGALPPGPA